ncbi:class I tRNA ligase family protein [Thermodesulfobacteriota bacterium]
MNKIWNAARFTLPYLDAAQKELTTDHAKSAPLPERWILSWLQKVTEEVREGVETCKFNDSAHALYQFTWHEFCDWYIEQVKIPFGGEDAELSSRCAVVLKHVLDSLLRLLHPFIPFITEEIASKIPSNGDTVMRGPFPQVDPNLVDAEAEEQMGLLMELTASVRTIRAEMGLPPSKRLPVFLMLTQEEGVREPIESNETMVVSLARMESLTLVSPSQ